VCAHHQARARRREIARLPVRKILRVEGAGRSGQKVKVAAVRGVALIRQTGLIFAHSHQLLPYSTHKGRINGLMAFKCWCKCHVVLSAAEQMRCKKHLKGSVIAAALGPTASLSRRNVNVLYLFCGSTPACPHLLQSCAKIQQADIISAVAGWCLFGLFETESAG
jgi:hypothetical protein